MPWLKMDDRFITNEKLISLTPHAKLLWAWSLGYAAGELTDGRISLKVLPYIAGLAGIEVNELPDELLASGLWEATESGYLIHDYLDYNPSKVEVQAERDAAKERMRKIRSPEVRPNTNQCSPELRRTSPKFANPVPGPARTRPVPDLKYVNEERETPPEVSTTETKAKTEKKEDDEYSPPNFNQANEGERLACQHQELMQAADSCWKLSKKDAKAWAGAYSRACRVRPHDEIQTLLAYAFGDKWWSQKSTNPFEFLLNITKIKFAMDGEAKSKTPPSQQSPPSPASNGSYFAPGSGWIGTPPTPPHSLRENNG